MRMRASAGDRPEPAGNRADQRPQTTMKNSNSISGFKAGMRGLQCKKNVSRPGVSTSHAGVNRCLDFMARKFCEPIQLRHLARISGMSQRGFDKAFRRAVGASPGLVLRRLRIEHAKRLLVGHDLTLKQIAKRCGFRSDNTLCITFLRIVGIPPKKYQRRYWLALCRNQQRAENQSPQPHRVFPLPDRTASRLSA